MVQAKLPDLNNYWIKYHDHGMFCLYSKNYAGCIAAIYNINALLPDEYRVEVSTKKYNELSRDKLVIICSKCEAEVNRNEIKIMTLLLSSIDSLISGDKSVQVWICSKCNGENDFIRSKKINDSHKNPTYYKVMPEPPLQKEGLTGRWQFYTKMTKWFFTCLEEEDHQLGLYRKEYQPESERDEFEEGGENAY